VALRQIALMWEPTYERLRCGDANGVVAGGVDAGGGDASGVQAASVDLGTHAWTAQVR